MPIREKRENSAPRKFGAVRYTVHVLWIQSIHSIVGGGRAHTYIHSIVGGGREHTHSIVGGGRAHIHSIVGGGRAHTYTA